MVHRTGNDWRLEIQAGKNKNYRLAQLDDYSDATRKNFLHLPPCSIWLNARLSESNLPGTWGFGFWNDPFGYNLGIKGGARMIPVLPNSAWFFYASPMNWLSIHKNIPANGFFAGTIAAPAIPSLLFAPFLPGLPLLALKPVSRLLRRVVGNIIRQDAVAISLDVTLWHNYSIEWLREYLVFKIDGGTILETNILPNPPLGLVIWIDNQFAAWESNGNLSYGVLENPLAWLEIKNITVTQ